MTAPLPLTTPPALRGAVATAFVSMAAAFGQGILLLVVVSLFEPGTEAWQDEGEDFSKVVLVGIIGTTIVAILLAVSAVLTMVLSSQGGRIMLFIAAGIAIAWNLGCGCILSIAWMTGAEAPDRNAGAEYYQSWQFTTAVLLGFLAGLIAVVTVILLAQKSVSRYYQALRTPGY